MNLTGLNMFDKNIKTRLLLSAAIVLIMTVALSYQARGSHSNNLCIAGPTSSHEVVSTTQGTKKNGSAVAVGRSNPDGILGNPDDTFYSLGTAGTIIVSFEYPVLDVSGDDITIYEITNGNRDTYPEELATVEVSEDGDVWFLVGTATNKAGSGVNSFDISGTGLTSIQYIRLTDTTDFEPHTPGADGFDIDAITAAHGICGTSIDLSIDKVVNNSDPEVGTDIAFTLTASNLGSETATGIEVIDVLPAEVTYVSDNGNGAYSPTTGIWSVGSLDAGLIAQLTITTTVDLPLTNGPQPFINTATISGDQIDDEQNNNDDSVTVTPQEENTTGIIRIYKLVEDEEGEPLDDNEEFEVELIESRISIGTDIITGSEETPLVAEFIVPSGYYGLNENLTVAQELTYEAAGCTIIDSGLPAAGFGLTEGEVIEILCTNIVLDNPTPQCTPIDQINNRWKADGSAIDSVGISNGTLIGGTSYAPGINGQAFSFDGVDDAINIDHDISLNPGEGNFSVSFWAKPTGIQETQAGLVKKEGNDYWLFETFSDNSILFAIRDRYPDEENRFAITGSSMDVDQWNHIVGVINQATEEISLYLNGTLQGTLAISLDEPIDNTTMMVIGRHMASFSGEIDDITLFHRALNSNDVSDLYLGTENGICDLQCTIVPQMSHQWKANGFGNDTIGIADGILLNGTTYAPGINGQAFSFDGVDDEINIDHDTSLNPGSSDFSVSFWAKPAGTQETQAGLVKKEGNDYWLFETFPNNSILFAIRDRYPDEENRFAIMGSSMDVDQWNHIVGVINQTTEEISLYLNGTLQGTLAISLDEPIDNTTMMVIGRHMASFSGEIDDITIYHQALDSTDVNDIYFGTENGICSQIPTQDADLSITKEVSNQVPPVNSTVTFTLTVENLGTSDATGAFVTDVLPLGLEYVSDDSSGAYSSGTGIWTIGDLANGSTASLNIVAKVTTSNALLNVASVSADQNDIDLNNNEASVRLLPKTGGVLVITKYVCDPTISIDGTWRPDGNGSFAPEGCSLAPDYEFAYALAQIENTNAGQGNCDEESGDPGNSGGHNNGGDEESGNNNGNGGDKCDDPTHPSNNNNGNQNLDDPEFVPFSDLTDANGQIIINDLEEGDYTIIELDENGNPVADQDILGLLCTDGDLPADDNGDDTTITSSSIAYCSAFNPLSSTTTPGIDLLIDKTVNNATTTLSSTIIFTIEVTNLGPDPATGVEVTDVLPSGLTYVSEDASEGSYSVSSGIWSIGDVAVNEVLTLDITATVDALGTVTNTATVIGNELELDPSNNTSNAAVTASEEDDGGGGDPTTGIDLSIDKTALTPTSTLNATTTFNLLVTNLGPDPATGVEVTDILPTGLTYVSDDSAGAYTSSTGIWIIGDLGVNSSTEININVILTTSTVLNTAWVVGDQLDIDPSNNTSTATISTEIIDDGGDDTGDGDDDGDGNTGGGSTSGGSSSGGGSNPPPVITTPPPAGSLGVRITDDEGSGESTTTENEPTPAPTGVLGFKLLPEAGVPSSVPIWSLFAAFTSLAAARHTLRRKE